MQALPRAEAPGNSQLGPEPQASPRQLTLHTTLCSDRKSSLNLHFAQMLHMDFMRGISLAQDMDDAHRHERRNCIRRLFAVLTAQLEDAATLAAQGQAKAVTFDTAADLAAQIHDIATDVTAITEAIERLCKKR